MIKLSADYIFTPNQKLEKDKVIILKEDGKVLEVVHQNEVDTADIQFYEGILTPGFINTHCHLELSHMKGKVPTGTGLLPFIESVVKTRGASVAEIQSAIEAAEQEMYHSGIVAVGDISNQVDTFNVKSKSKINFYTFIECFDFMVEANAQNTYQQYKTVYDQLETKNGDKKSFVPHAPYSVSDELYRLIRTSNAEESTISIHNQETPPESELFATKTGGFVDFYNSFNISLEQFQPTGKSSILSALPHLNPKNRNLFVHNTLTSKEDILAAQLALGNVYWATCANANLYIENRLPNYQYFIETNAKLTIGTDSLTSNWQLNILEEMKTIQRYQSYVTLEQLLTWATINGAEALGYDDLGSFEKGKIPGVVLISGVEGYNIQKAVSKSVMSN
jgi:cytosine/adenosine deaminase-related metal-dependent hydrolase